MVDVRVERFIEKLCELFPRWKSNPREELELVANIAIEAADNCNKTLESYCDQINYAYLIKRLAEDELGNTNMVYFLKNLDTNLIKIGKTRNIKQRMTEIRNASLQAGYEPSRYQLIGVIYVPFRDNHSFNYTELERELHEKFKDKRVLGEWFKLSTEEVYRVIRKYCPSDINGYPVGVHIKQQGIPEIIDSNEISFLKWCALLQSGKLSDEVVARYINERFLISVLRTIEKYQDKSVTLIIENLLRPQFDKLEST